MIKAIIVDWGGVLIAEPSAKINEYCADHLGVAIGDFLPARQAHIAEFQKGRISEEVFWGRVCAALGVTSPRVASLWNEAFRQAYEDRPDIIEFLQNLRRRGYKVGLLSTTELPAVKHFESQGYDMFDALIFSCREGVIKPERGIYAVALDRLGVQAKEAVFIDDRQENIQGAEEMGMHGVLFTGYDQLRHDLTNYGIEAI